MTTRKKKCPECSSLQEYNTHFCPICGFAFPDQPAVISIESSNPWKTVFFAIMGTLAVVGMTVGAYLLGTRSTESVKTSPVPEVLASNSVALSPTPPPVNRENTVSTNTNLATVTNANTSSAPKATTEQMRTKSQGSEEGWKYVSQTKDSVNGFYYYYQPGSVSEKGASVVAWTRTYPMYPVAFSKKEKLERPVDFVLEQVRFDCKDKTYYSIDQTYFDFTGSSIPPPLRFSTYHPIPPGTVLESMSQAVCFEALTR